MQRSFILSLLALLATLFLLVSPATSSAASCATMSQMLSRGMSGSDVSSLQLVLGVEQTGYFGPATEEAVKKFQRDRGIISSGDASTGYGMVGPRTIAALSCSAGQVLGASTLAIGDKVKISQNDVALRESPDLVLSLIKRLPAGTEATLLEGPNATNRYTWWRIQISDGTRGWVAEQFLAEDAPAPSYQNCTWAGGTVLHGTSVNAYEQYSVPSGHSCASQTRTCNNGTLSGTYAATSCKLGPGKSCTFNGTTIAHAGTVTAYEQYSVPTGSTCRSQVRTCDDGALSGTYSATTCKVEGMKSCTWAGGTVAHGASVTAYNQYSVPSGHQCLTQTRTCNNGTLSGTYPAHTCKLGPGKSCTFNGKTIAHAASVTAYISEKVAPGRTCASQTRTCDDGVLSGTYTAAACKVRNARACTFNSQSIPDGGTVTAYSKSKVKPSGECESETRTCSDGTLSGTYTEAKCKVRAWRGCTFDGKSIPHGETVTAYKTRKVGPTNTCVTEERVCTDGKLSGSYLEPKCKVRIGRACTFNGASVEHGATVTAYEQASVPAGSMCKNQARTCNDSVLSGSYTSTSCVVQQPGATGTISGFIWNDKDADVRRDTNETGFANQVVELLKNNIKIKEVRTDASGAYSFPSLASNTIYRVTHPVRIFKVTGGICNGKLCNSLDHSVEVTVKPATTATIDYGMRAPTGPCTVTLRDFGARGDGIADDTEAYNQAVLSKCSINGENLKYKISRLIQIEDRTNFSLKNATFINALPAGVRRVVYIGRSTGVTLENLIFNRGSDAYIDAYPDSSDLMVQASSDVTMKNIEIYGNGKGAALRVANVTGATLRDINIHDMRWASHQIPVPAYVIINGQVSPGGEKMVGLHIGNSKNVVIENTDIKNLTPHTSDAVAYDGTPKKGDNMTDALAVSGVTGLTVRNVDISNVGEGIDMSGTLAPRDFLIEDVTVENTGGSCIKSSRGLDDRGGPGIIRDSTVRNCGRDGFILAGNLSNVLIEDSLAENVGTNPLVGTLTVAAGFNVSNSYQYNTIPYVLTGWPTNITIKNSTARDTQAVHTMTHAFVDYAPSTTGAPNNKLINSKGSGYTKAEVVGFDD